MTEPADQLSLLRRKYVGREKGRIALPTSAQELWAQHKYSVMARSLDTCRSIGRAVARLRGSAPAVSLVRDLVLIVRECPDDRNTSTTIGQMWQHVRRHADADDVRCIERGPRAALLRIQALAMREREPVLLSSTALSDLAAFVCVP